VFLDGVPTIRRVPSISTWPEIEDAAEPILENGLYLGRSARDVARQLDEATRPLFARAEGS
jgi:multiple sugar transport system substrate-binding protein